MSIYPIEVLPLDRIERHEVQRETQPNHVKKIAANFDPRLLDPLTAVRYGNIVKVIDGGHRMEVLREVGETEAPVRIIGEDLTADEVGILFANLNKNKRPLSPLEHHLVSCIVGRKDATALQRAVDKAGFELGNAKTGRLSVQALEVAQRQGVLRPTLEMLTIFREREMTSIGQASVIRGIARFISDNPQLDKDDLKRLAATVDIDAIRDSVGRGQTYLEIALRLSAAYVGLLREAA